MLTLLARHSLIDIEIEAPWGPGDRQPPHRGGRRDHARTGHRPRPWATGRGSSATARRSSPWTSASPRRRSTSPGARSRRSTCRCRRLVVGGFETELLEEFLRGARQPRGPDAAPAAARARQRRTTSSRRASRPSPGRSAWPCRRTRGWAACRRPRGACEPRGRRPRLRDEQPAQRGEGAGAPRRLGARHPRPRGRGRGRRPRPARRRATSARPCGGSATRGSTRPSPGRSRAAGPCSASASASSSCSTRARRARGYRASACCPGRSGACAPTASCRTSAGAGSTGPRHGPRPRARRGRRADLLLRPHLRLRAGGPLPGARAGRPRRAVLRGGGPPRAGRASSSTPRSRARAGLGLLGRWLAGVRAARPAHA